MPTSCLQPAPPPQAPTVREQGPQEKLLAATVERAVLARAEYPVGTLADQVEEGLVRPEGLWVLVVDPATGERRWLENVFGSVLRDVPVSDGRWLAGIIADGTIMLADLAGGDATASLPLVEGQDASTRLLGIRDPWLIVRDAVGPFAFQIVTHERVDLPAGMHSEPLAIFEAHIAYLLPGQSEEAELQIMDLLTGQAVHVDDVPADTPLFAEPEQLTYSEYDEPQDVYFVRARHLSRGDTSIEMRIKAVPQTGHRQQVIGVNPRGYLLLNHYTNELGYPMEQIVEIRRGGGREFLHQYGMLLEPALGQPRIADPYLIFYDQVDGAWTFSNLEILTTWRAFLFRYVN
jgi:hypothetical protein